MSIWPHNCPKCRYIGVYVIEGFVLDIYTCKMTDNEHTTLVAVYGNKDGIYPCEIAYRVPVITGEIYSKFIAGEVLTPKQDIILTLYRKVFKTK